MTGGAAVQAGKMLTRLRTFFGWAVANDLVPADPTAGVRRPAKEAQRDRVLDDDEIRAFWTARGSARQAVRAAVPVVAADGAARKRGRRHAMVGNRFARQDVDDPWRPGQERQAAYRALERARR